MQPFSGSVFLLFTSWKSEYLNKQSQPLCPTIFSLCPHVVLGLAFVQPYSKLWKTAAHSEQAFFCSAPFFFFPPSNSHLTLFQSVHVVAHSH